MKDFGITYREPTPRNPIHMKGLRPIHLNRILILKIYIYVSLLNFVSTVRGCHSSRPAGCFHFDLQGNLNADDVTSAELWVYKLPDDGDRRQQTLVFSELTGPGYNTTQRSQELGHKYVSAKKRWVRFNVKSAVQRWLDDPKRNFGLLVSCKTCNRHISSSPIGSEDEIKPFIVVQTTDNHRRYRRTTNDCADRTDNHCCREHLYLNFAEIDWDHWITYPEGYTANYCKGVCYGKFIIICDYISGADPGFSIPVRSY